MDFISMVQFSSNWILVLACASLEGLVLFLVSAAAFHARSKKRNGKPSFILIYLILVLAWSAVNAAVIAFHPEFRKGPGILQALLADLPIAAAFFYFKAIGSFSGTEKFWDPATVALLVLVPLYPALRFLPQDWNLFVNILVLVYFIASAGIAFYYHSRHVHKTSSGNVGLFIQLIALVAFVLALVNDFAQSAFDFVLLPDYILVAGMAVLGAYLAFLFFRELPDHSTAAAITRDGELYGFQDELRKQYELTLEISRETGNAAEKLFGLIRGFVLTCSDSIGRISGMDSKVRNNVNDIKVKLSDFIAQISPLLDDKKKTEACGRDVDEIRNILEEIENKGKIVSSGVVNLTSVIDSATKNTDRSRQIILEIRTDMDNIESFSQTIDNIAGEANVLAMNAAIESANQTDKATNGFRVVSDDLRELSSRIKGQTTEIQKVLTFLKQDLDTGIRSTQDVKNFFGEIELIIENIFRLILNIVNHSDVISNTVEETRQNIGSLQDISSRMEEMTGRNSVLTAELNREIEQTRANFYQVGILINKGKEVFEAMSETVEKNGDRLQTLKADRKVLEKALIDLSGASRNG